MLARAVMFGAAIALGLHAVPGAAQPGREQGIPRIGFLSPTFGGFSDLSIGVWLRALGYHDGRTAVFVRRFVPAARRGAAARLAGELVAAGPDVIVAPGIEAARAAREATHGIPIVMVADRDPVQAGLVASLERPGGNVTGVNAWIPDAPTRRLALLAEALPGLVRVGVLWNPDSPDDRADWDEVRAAARALGLDVTSLPARDQGELEAVIATVTAEPPRALLVLGDRLFFAHARALGDAAARAGVPSMYPSRWFLETYERGGLLSFGPSGFDVSRRVAVFVDRILRGARPADLPVWQLPRFELVVNLRTARAIGLTLPPSVLISADKVID